MLNFPGWAQTEAQVVVGRKLISGEKSPDVSKTAEPSAIPVRLNLCPSKDRRISAHLVNCG